jgi:hypothetical protein
LFSFSEISNLDFLKPFSDDTEMLAVHEEEFGKNSDALVLAKNYLEKGVMPESMCWRKWQCKKEKKTRKAMRRVLQNKCQENPMYSRMVDHIKQDAEKGVDFEESFNEFVKNENIQRRVFIG